MRLFALMAVLTACVRTSEPIMLNAVCSTTLAGCYKTAEILCPTGYKMDSLYWRAYWHTPHIFRMKISCK